MQIQTLAVKSTRIVPTQSAELGRCTLAAVVVCVNTLALFAEQPSNSPILTTSILPDQEFTDEVTGLTMRLPKEWREGTAVFRKSRLEDMLRTKPEATRADLSRRIAVKLCALSGDPQVRNNGLSMMVVSLVDLRDVPPDVRPKIAVMHRRQIEARKNARGHVLVSPPTEFSLGGKKFTGYEQKIGIGDASRHEFFWIRDAYIDGWLVNIQVTGN